MKKLVSAVLLVPLFGIAVACRDETPRAEPEKSGRLTEVSERTLAAIRMEEMNWLDIKRAIESGFTTVVVAVGSTEQHGPHLPTMTDARIGEDVAERVARKLGRALLARTIDVGLSDHHMAFAGTISFKAETLLLIIRDYVSSLAGHGFTRIVLIPMHGGNFTTTEQAIGEARKAHPGVDITGFTDLAGLLDFLARTAAGFGVSVEAAGAHAGECETSMMMALEGRLVAIDRFAPGYLGPFGEAELKLMWRNGVSSMTANGILGDPGSATAEKGEAYLEGLADFVVSMIGPKKGS